MNFLTPLYFLAFAALAAPIVLHLIRRQTKQDQVFSSLMFLSPSPPRVNKRSRIDNWLLLLIRSAVLALFAFAFTRPFVSASADLPLKTDARLRIVLVDRSASMAREDLWAQAIAAANDVVEDLTPQDAVAIIAYDQTAEVLLSADTKLLEGRSSQSELAKQSLQELKSKGPTHFATNHVAAIQTAIEQFEQFRSSNAWVPSTICEAIVVSDLQVGEELDRLRTLQWPKALRLIDRKVQPKDRLNVTATLLGKMMPSSEEKTASAVTHRVRLENHATDEKAVVQLSWLSDDGVTRENLPGQFDIPAGQVRVVQIASPSFESGSLELTGDQVDFDNSFYFYEPRSVRKQIAYLSDRESKEDGTDIGYFLSKISTNEARDLPAVITADSGQLDVLLQKTPPLDLIVLNSDLRAGTALQLRDYLDKGGRCLLVLDRLPSQLPELEEWYRTIFADETITVKEAEVDDFLLWQNIDFQSPLFAPFNDPRANNFAKIHFWKAREVQLSNHDDWRTLVSFDSGAPALLQATVGQGNLYLLTSGWHITDSQLALSTKFVPLLFNMVGDSTKDVPQLSWIAGQPLARSELENVVTIGIMAGSQQPLQDSFIPTQAGLYRATNADSSSRVIAVNLARSECDTSTLSFDQFEQHGVAVEKSQSTAELMQNARQMRNTELEATQQWWRWLLVSGLLLIVFETAVSGRRTPASES